VYLLLTNAFLASRQLSPSHSSRKSFECQEAATQSIFLAFSIRKQQVGIFSRCKIFMILMSCFVTDLYPFTSLLTNQLPNSEFERTKTMLPVREAWDVMSGEGNGSSLSPHFEKCAFQGKSKDLSQALQLRCFRKI
jgi:hypothetical protein